MIICAVHNVPLHGFNRHHYERCLTVFSRSENAAWHAPKEIRNALRCRKFKNHENSMEVRFLFLWGYQGVLSIFYSVKSSNLIFFLNFKVFVRILFQNFITKCSRIIFFVIFANSKSYSIWLHPNKCKTSCIVSNHNVSRVFIENYLH